jgi:hypothetical protein
MDVFQSKLDSLLAIKVLEIYSDDIVAEEEVLEQIRGSQPPNSTPSLDFIQTQAAILSCIPTPSASPLLEEIS